MSQSKVGGLSGKQLAINRIKQALESANDADTVIREIFCQPHTDSMKTVVVNCTFTSHFMNSRTFRKSSNKAYGNDSS